MSESATKNYVCDHCGNFWRAMRATDCPACKSDALWEYDREQPAREHAALVKAAR